MVVVLAGLFMGCPTLLSPSICYVMLCYLKGHKINYICNDGMYVKKYISIC